MKYSGIKHFPSNWTNGMKLTADHFQHLENSSEAAVSDARATAVLANVGYGLLPASKFTIRNAEGQATQTVRVILEACQAILPGGRRIEILPANIKNLQIPKQAPYVEFMPNPGVRYHLFLRKFKIYRLLTFLISQILIGIFYFNFIFFKKNFLINLHLLLFNY
ncbi:MAG: hypothetical protein ACPGED_07000 [Flavobacteriales bacterium]